MIKKALARTTRRKGATATAGRKPAPRADLGAPVDAWFARQPQPHRDALRALVDETAPDAQGSLKWGMPFYTLGSTMVCALTSHKTHVNLVLSGPSASFADPDGRLEGTGKTGRHLKLRALEELPRAQVRRWVRTAAAFARRP